MLNIVSHKCKNVFFSLAFALALTAPSLSYADGGFNPKGRDEDFSKDIANMLKRDDVRVILLIDSNGNVRALSAHDNKTKDSKTKLPQGKELIPCDTTKDKNCTTSNIPPINSFNIGVKLYQPLAPDPCLAIIIGGSLVNICW